MCFKFNSGNGAVVCDRCSIIFDGLLSPKQYRHFYGINDGDYCWRCRQKDKSIPIAKIPENNPALVLEKEYPPTNCYTCWKWVSEYMLFRWTDTGMVVCIECAEKLESDKNENR